MSVLFSHGLIGCERNASECPERCGGSDSSYEGSLGLEPKPSDCFTLRGSPDSMMSLDRQGTLRMKNPQVISPQAQESSGPMRYMVSVVLAKATVWERRKHATTEALKESDVSWVVLLSYRFGILTVYRRRK